MPDRPPPPECGTSTILSRSTLFYIVQLLQSISRSFLHGKRLRIVRLETEHQGNADSYRVTRDIPLPYRRIDPDTDDDDLTSKPKDRSNLDKLRAKILGRTTHGRGVDALNVGPRGHAKQREYEASRPGDYPTRGTTSDENV